MDVRGLAVLVTGAVAALVLVSACGNSTGGQANPATTTTQGQPEQTSTPSGGGQSGLPVSQPCSLLSSGDLSQLGVSAQPQQVMVGTAHACNFDSADFALGVAIRTDGGLGAFTSAGGTVQDTTVGKHQAKQELDNTGSCVIGIGVSASSRVDITATGDGTTDPCPTALKLANLVEPKLP